LWLDLFSMCTENKLSFVTRCCCLNVRDLIWFVLLTWFNELSLCNAVPNDQWAWKRPLSLRKSGHASISPAKFTVQVGQLVLANCVQAHDDCLEVLAHIILYLLTRRPRTIGSDGHVTAIFFQWSNQAVGVACSLTICSKKYVYIYM